LAVDTGLVGVIVGSVDVIFQALVLEIIVVLEIEGLEDLATKNKNPVLNGVFYCQDYSLKSKLDFYGLCLKASRETHRHFQT